LICELAINPNFQHINFEAKFTKRQPNSFGCAHHIFDIALADNPITSLVCISCGISLSPPIGDFMVLRHHCQSLVILSTASGLTGWSLKYDFLSILQFRTWWGTQAGTPGLNLDTLMPHIKWAQ